MRRPSLKTEAVLASAAIVFLLIVGLYASLRDMTIYERPLDGATVNNAVSCGNVFGEEPKGVQEVATVAACDVAVSINQLAFFAAGAGALVITLTMALLIKLGRYDEDAVDQTDEQQPEPADA